jgi:ribose/xylose/arabinose/galactoside ABC-type transport system permease subunit
VVSLPTRTAAEPPVHETGGGRPGLRTILGRILLSDYLVLLLTVAYVLAILPFTDNLLSSRNIENVLSNYWPLLIVVVGQTFVLIIAGIDLSQTAIMAMANTVGALFVTTALNPALYERSVLWGWFLGPEGSPASGSPFAVPLAWAAVIVVGALIGGINGLAISRFGMPPFMVTLATLLFFSSAAVWLTRSENVTNLPENYLVIGDGGLFGVVPYAMLIAVVLTVAAHLLLSRTTFGRWSYAVGANARAALVSGVPVRRVIATAYLLSGIFAAVGAVLYSTRLESGRPTLGASLLLDVIGAAVIGGVSLFGGKGRVLGAAIGVLFFVVLANGLNLLQLPFYTVLWVKGVVIAVAAFLDVVRTRRAEAQT